MERLAYLQVASSAAEAGLESGDIVLVKGSRGMGMEEIVEALALPDFDLVVEAQVQPS